MAQEEEMEMVAEGKNQSQISFADRAARSARWPAQYLPKIEIDWEARPH